MSLAMLRFPVATVCHSYLAAVLATLLGGVAMGCGRLHFDPVDASQGALDSGLTDLHVFEQGVTDRGPVDLGDDDLGSPDAGYVSVCPLDALFCSNFDALLGEWDMEFAASGYLAELVVSPRLEGLGSVRFAAEGTGDGFAVLVRDVAPVTTGQIFARVNVYLPISSPIIAYTVFFELSDGDTSGSQKISLDFIEPDTLQLAATTATATFAAGAAPQERWSCMELEVVVDDANGAVILRVDSETRVDEGGIDTLPAGGFRRILAGMVNGAGTNPSELFLDDLVVSTSSPLPCP